jgi:methyl-accepting chemotaxis protein
MNRFSVKWQISLLSIFFIVVSLFTTFSMVQTLDQQRLDSRVVNTAGRQRMLIQKFTKEFFLQRLMPSNTEKPYEKTGELFTLSLNALINGGETFADLGMTKPITLPATKDTAALAGLADVKKLWRVQREALLSMLTKTDISDAELVTLDTKSNQLVGAMNKVVGMVAQVSQENVESLINLAKLLLLLTIIVGVALSYFIVISVTRPLIKLGLLSKEFCNGKLDQVVPESLQQGNNEISTLARGFESMREVLENLLRSVQSSSLEIKNTAQEVSYISKTIIEGSEQQDAKSQEVKTSVDSLLEIAHIVKQEVAQASDYVKRSEIKASDGITVAHSNIVELDKAVDSVNGASEMMQHLSESTGKMHAIVDSIQNIAGQTNLLALNAAIEAARAGEQGRGFAVVADEVRTLASRTAVSTDEISSLIEDFSTKVSNSVDSMSELVLQVNTIQGQSQVTIESFEEMNLEVANTARSNEQILDYNAQQTHQVEQLSVQFQDLFKEFKNNANKADSTSLVAESLYENAEYLRENVSHFKVRSGISSHRVSELRKQPRVKSTISATLRLQSGHQINALIDNLSTEGCRLISKEEIGQESVSITIRIPSSDTAKFENQAPLTLNADILRLEKCYLIDAGNEKRCYFGLKFTDMQRTDKGQLDSAIAFFTDIKQSEA